MGCNGYHISGYAGQGSIKLRMVFYTITSVAIMSRLAVLILVTGFDVFIGIIVIIIVSAVRITRIALFIVTCCHGDSAKEHT